MHACTHMSTHPCPCGTELEVSIRCCLLSLCEWFLSLWLSPVLVACALLQVNPGWGYRRVSLCLAFICGCQAPKSNLNTWRANHLSSPFPSDLRTVSDVLAGSVRWLSESGCHSFLSLARTWARVGMRGQLVWKTLPVSGLQTPSSAPWLGGKHL